ncbi:MAG: hypothetical protein L3J84_12825 [Gammaproteobacteria bacterium]|nr:hypothetical protein [Gammaproteobacteria bacterium]
MSLNLIISFILAGLFIISAVLMIALLFYIGRTRIKEIDKVVHGFEIPNDSIFFLVLRAPIYGFAFLWKWYAKIVKYESKLEQFDRRFRWPFIATSLLAFF